MNKTVRHLMKARSPEWEALKIENQRRRLEFAQKLTFEEKLTLAKIWVDSHFQKDNLSEFKKADNRVASCLFDASVGFEIIALIWGVGLDEEKYSYLGVVVEDFLSIHGEDVVGQIEALVSKDASFIKVLRFVYRNTMPEDVHRRVCALAGGNNA